MIRSRGSDAWWLGVGLRSIFEVRGQAGPRSACTPVIHRTRESKADHATSHACARSSNTITSTFQRKRGGACIRKASGRRRTLLEIMLLRAIERSIFEQTAAWLATDKSNVFTVVLDEAHMYRGSGGAEVAYLLRRLDARLGVPRDRVKYILTSASLGKSAEAVARMKSFAADLSGLGSQGREFMLIKGEQLKKTGECPATTSEAGALAAYAITTLHNSVLNPVAASEGFGILLDALGQKPPASQDNQAGLQQVVYEWLQSFGPAALITNEVTAQPRQLREVARLAFPSSDKAAEAMEAMLALMSFAKEKDSGRVFAPVRSHMFFRGLAGIFACVDPTCTERGTSGRASLGKTYSLPMLRCACGSRVYEILTHRDCGAAFIRGYVQNELGKFLWHQPSTGLWGEGGLVEAHFLVEVDRRAHGNGTRGRMEGTQVWLHKATGQLVVQPPSVEVEPNQYLALLRPDGLVPVSAGQRVLSFDKKCPVCTRHWHPGTTKIMDLATKGET